MPYEAWIHDYFILTMLVFITCNIYKKIIIILFHMEIRVKTTLNLQNIPKENVIKE